MLRVFLILVVVMWTAAAQTIAYQPGYRFGTYVVGPPEPWGLDLVPAKTGGREGKVYFRQTDDGILINGHVTGTPPNYARFPAEMGTREYVGISIALSDRVNMPEFGWGNHWGLTNCKAVEAVPLPDRRAGWEDCRPWEARQAKYRDQLRRLFVRHWQISPQVSIETYASDAFQNVCCLQILSTVRASKG